MIYINKFRMDQNLNQWLDYFNGKVSLQYKRNGQLRETEIWPDGKTWYKQYTVRSIKPLPVKRKIICNGLVRNSESFIHLDHKNHGND